MGVTMGQEPQDIFIVEKDSKPKEVLELFSGLDAALQYCLYAQKEEYNNQRKRLDKNEVMDTKLANGFGIVRYDFDKKFYYLELNDHETLTVRKMRVRL